MTEFPPMGINEFEDWCNDAWDALCKVYTEAESECIVDWFRHIKGSDEYELIGHERLEAFLTFSTPENVRWFNVYSSMMSRVWIYAPYILKKAGF